MAGTGKNYNTAMVEVGPGDVWLNVALPGAAARMVLATDGTPDATANPSALHLGMTEAGSKITYAPSITKFESDELTSPIIVQNVQEALTIEGNMLQMLDTLELVNLIVGGTRTAGSGYEQITMGGKQTVATFTVCLIVPIYADVTKFLVYQLYKAYNDGGFNADISRKAMTKTPYKFMGLGISTRAAGDQTGTIWKTIT